MNVTSVYAIVAGGLFAVLTTIQFLVQGYWFLKNRLLRYILRYAIYPYFISRHRLFGPWTYGYACLQITYWALTLFCNSFAVKSLKEAGKRAGFLCLINMVPLYLSFHLSFIADVLGLLLQAYRQIHASVSYTTLGLAIFHSISSQRSSNYLSESPSHLFGLIVSRAITSANKVLIINREAQP